MKKEIAETKPCKNCGKQPTIVDIDGCWYAYCSNCVVNYRGSGGKPSKYNICRLSKEKVIDAWNEQNIKTVSNIELKKEMSDYALMDLLKKAVKPEKKKRKCSILLAEKAKPERLG